MKVPNTGGLAHFLTMEVAGALLVVVLAGGGAGPERERDECRAGLPLRQEAKLGTRLLNFLSCFPTRVCAQNLTVRGPDGCQKDVEKPKFGGGILHARPMPSASLPV